MMAGLMKICDRSVHFQCFHARNTIPGIRTPFHHHHHDHHYDEDDQQLRGRPLLWTGSSWTARDAHPLNGRLPGHLSHHRRCYHISRLIILCIILKPYWQPYKQNILIPSPDPAQWASSPRGSFYFFHLNCLNLGENRFGKKKYLCTYVYGPKLACLLSGARLLSVDNVLWLNNISSPDNVWSGVQALGNPLSACLRGFRCQGEHIPPGDHHHPPHHHHHPHHHSPSSLWSSSSFAIITIALSLSFIRYM